jgi:hypothetical protein
MEYLLIFVIQIIGIGFHVFGKVVVLDKLYPDDSMIDVFKLFWKTDRFTVFISLWIVAAYELLYFLAYEYAPAESFVYDSDYFDLIYFLGALVLGYAGQQLVYKALGKAVDIANKKIDEQK